VTFTAFTGTNTTSGTANDATANPFQVTGDQGTILECTHSTTETDGTGGTIACVTHSSSPNSGLLPGEAGSLTYQVTVDIDYDLIANDYIIHNDVEIDTETPETTKTDNPDEWDVPLVLSDLASLS